MKRSDYMKFKYGHLSDDLIELYLNNLVGRVYKILPMKEEDSLTLNTYISSLAHELTGFYLAVEKGKQDEYMLRVLLTLENLIDNDNTTSQDIYKREVFKCINLIKKIQQRGGG